MAQQKKGSASADPFTFSPARGIMEKTDDGGEYGKLSPYND